MEPSMLGQLAALSVSFCWAVSSTVFEKSGRRVGSIAVNYIRLLISFIGLGIYEWISRGHFLPVDAGPQQWIWLSISGFIGFFLGDLCLFKSYTLIGAQLSMLVMTFSPALTALIGYIILGERLSLIQAVAIMIIIAGILLAFIPKRSNAVPVKLSLKGFLLALGGASGQALGYVFSKKGIGQYDPFAATQIRIMAGLAGFTLLILELKRMGEIRKTFHDSKAVGLITVGAFFGPVLGVSLSMYALKGTNTGIASALMSVTPVVLILVALLKGVRVRGSEIAGALLAVGGVMMLFL